MMQAMGHNKVKVLAGGLPKWKKEGKPMEADDKDANQADFAYKLNPERIKLYEQMAEYVQAEEKQFQLIDPRPPAEFTNGHIPGSVNIPFAKLINSDKELLSIEERQKVFVEAGIDLSKNITCSCGGGIQASVLFTALSDLATAELAVNDGSYSEWASKNK